MAERKKDKDKDADSTDVNLKKNYAMIFENFCQMLIKKKIIQWYLKTFARSYACLLLISEALGTLHQSNTGVAKLWHLIKSFCSNN